MAELTDYEKKELERLKSITGSGQLNENHINSLLRAHKLPKEERERQARVMEEAFRKDGKDRKSVV